MADDSTTDGGLPPNLDAAIGSFIEQFFDPAKLERLQRAIGNGTAWGNTASHGAITAAVSKGSSELGDVLTTAEDYARGAMAWVLAHMVAHLLGIEVPPEGLRNAFRGGPESVVGKAVGETVLSGISGTGTSIEPGDAGAVRLIGMLSNLELTAWFEGILVELVQTKGGFFPPINAIAELGHDLVDALGLGRLARVALRPLVQTTIATPLEWKVHKTFRPTLLGASTVLRQFTRGRWDWADVEEELARQGYSTERIDALLNEQQKFLSVGDVQTMLTRGEWTTDQAVQHLGDQGYDDAAARRVLRVEGLKRIEQLETAIASSLVSAYANREIDKGTLDASLAAAISPPTERALISELADWRQKLNVKHLSSAQAAACVRAGVLSTVDYRRALEREGYTDESVIALELLLGWELDKEQSIEDQRAKLVAERAAEKLARDEAAKKRQLEVEQQRALARRGSLSDLSRAVVRGLISIARLEEVLNAEYDPDTVELLVHLVEGDRQKYLDDQQRAADARQRGAQRSIDVGALEQAVLENILSLGDFLARLGQLGFPAADAAILTATLAARKRDLDAARAKRDAAEAAARRKSIDLVRFEALVRRGHRTLAQYDALLTGLGFDDASRAAMGELLQLKIADDATAAATRAAAELKLREKGLSIEQLRRGVILGVQTTDDYQTFLVNEGFTADAQIVLMAELRDDVANAEAARQRRQAGGAATGPRELPLATVARAARLGIISPNTYQARLERLGYSADDVTIELELLLTEIADVQAARAARDQVTTDTAGKPLSLTEIAAAVKHGFKSLEDYRAAAIVAGFSADAVATQIRVLADELEATNTAKSRRAEIAGALDLQKLSLAALEDQVRSGLLSVAAFTDTLQQQGIAIDDAALVASLLVEDVSGQ